MRVAVPAPVHVRRSLLFVPGSRPDRFEKALSAGADCVCIDLEDAVAPGDKATARVAVLDYLKHASKDADLLLRLNSLRSLEGIKDLAAFVDAGGPARTLMLPKVGSVEEIELADEILGSLPTRLIPLIETADALLRAETIAAAPRLDAVMLGGVDLAADLRCELAWEPLLWARQKMVIATARAGVDLIDAPQIDVQDDAMLDETTRRARALGFTGRSAIHPKQIDIINRAFTPHAEEITHAKRVVEAFEAAKGGVALLDGKLVERPVVRAMQRVLATASRG
jgi:citrate lyase beta subunit